MIIQTGDGSITLRSEEYDEPYHTKSGALEESQKKYIEPCGIRNGMSILDIGFGLGYNILMALHAAKKLRVVSLEKDVRVEIQDLEVPEELQKEFDIIKKLARDGKYKDEMYDMEIKIGNATHTITEINELFDAVFLDPFSPPKNPEMWTIEFLTEVYRVMKPGAILATYSCAGHVRRNLKAIGFEVKDGPIIGRRSPSTLALKN